MNDYIKEHVRTMIENKLMSTVHVSKIFTSLFYDTLLIEPVSQMDITAAYSKLKADSDIKQFELINKANLYVRKHQNRNKLFMNY